MIDDRLFISYAHADVGQENWLNRLQLYLSQARRIDGLDVWDDSRLGSGTRWKDEIEQALDSACAVVLLVGPGFLGSSFINDVELPRILDKNRTRGIGLFPLVVGYCHYARSILSEFQSFNDPEVPLESLPVPEQNRILNSVATAVSEHVRNREPRSLESRSKAQSADDLRDLVEALRMTRTAFRPQVKRRDELVAQMRRRLGIEGSLQYERFFVRFFQEMDEDDRFLFQQIRAMTDGPLREGNAKSLTILERSPQLLDRYPRLWSFNSIWCFGSTSTTAFSVSGLTCVFCMRESRTVWDTLVGFTRRWSWHCPPPHDETARPNIGMQPTAHDLL